MLAKVSFVWHYYINQKLYTCSGAAPGFWFGGARQNFIHDFLSSPVLQLRRQNFGSGGRQSAKMYSSKTFEKFWKFYNKFAQNLKNSPKFFKNKI